MAAGVAYAEKPYVGKKTLLRLFLHGNRECRFQGLWDDKLHSGAGHFFKLFFGDSCPQRQQVLRRDSVGVDENVAKPKYCFANSPSWCNVVNAKR